MSIDSYEREYLDLRHKQHETQINLLAQEVKALTASNAELKSSLESAENHVRAVEAFITSKYPTELEGPFSTLFWQQELKRTKETEQRRFWAMDDLRQAGYLVTKNSGC